jgi:4-hydroxy-3-methylbut-2-enyl diphosphate reductase IspH
MELTRCVWYISPYGGGEPPEGFDRRRVYDTTCVVVEAEWKTAEQAVQRGRRVVFCGEQSHPEATSLMRRFPNGVVVVETPGDLECLDVGAGPFTVLSQSTFSTRAAHAIIEELYEIDGAEVEDLREVCPQVAHRKREAATLGKFKPAVVIIGRHESHHAREMARLAREEGCERVEIISSAEEAAALGLSDGIEVGLLSTTSTPEELVEAVAAALRG